MAMFAYKSLLLWAAVLVKLVATVPSVASSLAGSSVEFGNPASDFLAADDVERVSLGPEEIHSNILQNFPAERVTTSDKLNEYLASHHDEPEALIYLSDVQGFASMVANSSNEELSARQPPPCQNYHYYRVKASVRLWDPWVPISICTRTGLSDQPASRSIDWSVTKTIEFNFGFDSGKVRDMMSASLGFSVSTSVTQGERATCNIGRGSVGQIWTRNQIGFAGLKRVQVYCGGHDEQPQDYWAVAPVDSPGLAKLEHGCSTGEENVWCERNYGHSGNWA